MLRRRGYKLPEVTPDNVCVPRTLQRVFVLLSYLPSKSPRASIDPPHGSNYAPGRAGLYRNSAFSAVSGHTPSRNVLMGSTLFQAPQSKEHERHYRCRRTPENGSIVRLGGPASLLPLPRNLLMV